MNLRYGLLLVFLCFYTALFLLDFYSSLVVHATDLIFLSASIYTSDTNIQYNLARATMLLAQENGLCAFRLLILFYNLRLIYYLYLNFKKNDSSRAKEYNKNC